MVLVDAWKTVVTERYALFQGRAARPEFWWYFLANFIIYVILAILIQITGIFVVLEILYGLAVLIPGIAVGIRRLHDTNRSGWWLLIGLVPFVGGIILIVFLCLEGTPGPNQYGEVAELFPAT